MFNTRPLQSEREAVNYLKSYSTRTTPQSEPIPGSTQIENSAGGHAWQVDDWMRLERFLILGAEGGTYYAGERKLVAENADCVWACAQADGLRTVDTIVEISTSGRAPKNDPAIFALALLTTGQNDETRKAALNAVSAVCRTGTHLFTFATFVEQHRGWGRGLRRAVGAWYNDKDADDAAYQVVKYRQRGGWTHRDLLRLAHPVPLTEEHDDLYRWLTGKEYGSLPEIVAAYELAQASASPRGTAALIREFPSLPREALNTKHLNSVEVWDALLRAGMPMTALIRNLATMSRIGLLTPMSEAARIVVDQIDNGDLLHRSRVHPLAVLVAMKTYEQGFSDRSGQTWTPVNTVVDALNDAFYVAFGNVTPSGKRTMLALDVSGSMDWPNISNMTGITPRIGSAAMALVTAAVEPEHCFTAFSTSLVDLTISPRQRLDDVINNVRSIRMGGTDCALPMISALERGLEVDTFVIYTDSETWHGQIHPAQALRAYREKTGIPAKLVVVGMVSNGFTIADPNDAGMLDVVGFDTATPDIISQFSAS